MLPGAKAGFQQRTQSMADMNGKEINLRNSRQFNKSNYSTKKSQRKIDEAISKRSARVNPNHREGDEFVEHKYSEKVVNGEVIRRRVRVVRRQIKEDVWLTNEEVKEMELIFRTFDADNSNNIEVAELKNAMKALGMNKSKEELKVIMENADKDGSGDIDLQEFKVLMADMIK